MSQQLDERDWFYWFMAAFTALQFPICALVLIDFVLHPMEPDYISQSTGLRLVNIALIFPLALLVSVLVIRRAPGNVTGLFLLQWATSIASTSVRSEPSIRVLYGMSLGWAGLWFLPLFFPDGRAFPRRFARYIRWLCAGLVFSLYLWTFTAPSLSQPPDLTNPLYIEALAGLQPLASALEYVLLLSGLVLIIPSMVLRYRGSDQRIRQQIKWLVWLFFGILLSSIPVMISGISIRDPQTLNALDSLILMLWSIFIILAPFFAVSIAILRHRLYDIDIIIRRTLIYSVLTAMLAVIYFGGVVLAQQVFKAATGEASDLALVISTLLIAALFTPLRRRIQQAIDRRFYRRKYDAEQTVAQFNQFLRDEVNLETLKLQLLGVVQETMQPADIALWVKEA